MSPLGEAGGQRGNEARTSGVNSQICWGRRWAEVARGAESLPLHHCCPGLSVAPGVISVCRILIANLEDLL